MAGCLAVLLIGILGCSSVPKVSHRKHSFPTGKVFLESPKLLQGQVIEKIGLVRAKVNFPAFDPARPEVDAQTYCRNYYNRAANELYGYAKEKGGDAVMQVRSVVFYMDGKHELFKTPECSDDGDEGQILLQGTAIKLKTVVSEISTTEQ